MNEETILVSVIVPVYNTEKYLTECIESILNQTEQRFELILVDDGSTDKSGIICDKYAINNERIRVLHQVNKGVSAARNNGIRNANGMYIVFVDSDDWIESDYLRILLMNMCQGGMSTCELIINNTADSVEEEKVVRLDKSAAYISTYSCFGMQGFPVVKMFDRNLLIENNIYFDEEINICEDVLFVINYLYFTNKPIFCSNRILYHYRKMNEGATNKRYEKSEEFNEKWLTEIEAIKRTEQYILMENESVKEAFDMRYVKAAVNTLRAIVANQYSNVSVYKELLSCIRRGSIKYLLGDIGTLSAKVSVALCAISPKLEVIVWKKINS